MFSIIKFRRGFAFHFNRIPRLWNFLPPIDLDLSSQTIRTKIKTFLWEQFLNKFVSNCPCTFHFKCPCSRCSYISISRYSKKFLVGFNCCCPGNLYIQDCHQHCIVSLPKTSITCFVLLCCKTLFYYRHTHTHTRQLL